MPLSPNKALNLSRLKREARINEQVKKFCTMIDDHIKTQYLGQNEYQLPQWLIQRDIAEEIANEIIQIYKRVGWKETTAHIYIITDNGDCVILVNLRIRKEGQTDAAFAK